MSQIKPTYSHNHYELLNYSPAEMPLLANNMIVVRPTLKIALWPKLSMASVDVVFKEDDS